MIDTIIFDGEGVVIDTETIWDWGQEEFLRRRNLVYDREKIKPLLTGKSLIDGVRAMMDEYGFSGDPKELARERKEIVRELFEHKVTFIDGFREFFDRVSKTCKTCIASAMAEDLLKVVDESLGLSKLFNGRIFTIADVGYRSKPHPDLFLFAARQLNSEVRNCVVIEDSPFGVEAAKRAGMKCIALTTTYGREKLPGADLVVSSFPEIDLKACHAKG